MAQETTKATKRRLADKSFDWRTVFRGRCIDVGAGDDALKPADWPLLTEVIPFDQEHGNAERLDEYFPPESFDTLAASQVLEHMSNPYDALERWLKVIKPEGYLVITVPSWELYERMRWPSVTNGDHKSSWSMWQKGSIAPVHVYVPELVETIKQRGHFVPKAELVDTNFDYSKPYEIDQTWICEHGVECWIELVIHK